MTADEASASPAAASFVFGFIDFDEEFSFISRRVYFIVCAWGEIAKAAKLNSLRAPKSAYPHE